MSLPVAPNPNGKTLILCFDSELGRHGLRRVSNVMQIFRALEKHNERQVCYYQPGLGMYFRLLFFPIELIDFRHVYPADKALLGAAK